jgi:hypothetical protein
VSLAVSAMLLSEHLKKHAWYQGDASFPGFSESHLQSYIDQVPQLHPSPQELASLPSNSTFTSPLQTNCHVCNRALIIISVNILACAEPRHAPTARRWWWLDLRPSVLFRSCPDPQPPPTTSSQPPVYSVQCLPTNKYAAC